MPRGRPRKVDAKSKASTTNQADAPKLHCIMCGSSNQTNFYLSKDKSHSFFGKIPYCKNCVKEIFLHYCKLYDDINLAVYYTCRKIDIPYIHSNYLGAIEAINNPDVKMSGDENVFGAYMKGIAFAEKNGWGTSFDDSQGENSIEKLASYDEVTKIKRNKINNPSNAVSDEEEYEVIEYDTDVLQSKWGNTFENWELSYLESEYLDWEEKLNGINDKTIDILVKQICYQLLDIYKDRQSGTSVDKKIKTLRELMNDSGLMEKQNKATAQRKNIGMTIRDIEYHRPIPMSEPIFDDVDGVKNYIYGAAGCYFKANGIENEYTKFFDEWMKDYSVDVVTDLLEEKKKEERMMESVEGDFDEQQ